MVVLRIRKRPVEHEAVRYEPDCSNREAVLRFLGADGRWREDLAVPAVRIRTMHGEVTLEPGAYAVRGTEDVWPVAASQFDELYEVVSMRDEAHGIPYDGKAP